MVRFADQANRTIDFNSFFALWCSLLDNTFDSLRLVARGSRERVLFFLCFTTSVA